LAQKNNIIVGFNFMRIDIDPKQLKQAQINALLPVALISLHFAHVALQDLQNPTLHWATAV